MRISDWSSDVCSSDLCCQRRLRFLLSALLEHLVSDLGSAKAGTPRPWRSTQLVQRCAEFPGLTADLRFGDIAARDLRLIVAGKGGGVYQEGAGGRGE